MARNPARSTGMKRKDSGGSSKAKSTSIHNPAKMEDIAASNAAAEEQNSIDNGDEPQVYKRPKRAAACLNFKEKSIKLSEVSSTIETKKNRIVEDEIVAVDLTKLGPEDLPPCRKLLDFVLHDADGNPQPFEMSEFDDLFITALMMPLDDNLEKEKERGVKCEGFGRIETWSISGYDEGVPVIWLSTASADYECVKPASNYRKFYDRFYGKVHICIEVYRKLAKTAGGNPNLSLDELVAGVIRSMSGNKNFSCGVISRDFVISIGEFVYNQLIGLDENQEKNDVSLATVPALLALRDECRSRSEYCKVPAQVSNGSLKIKERENFEADEDDDAKLARLLQQEEDWIMMKQQKGRRPVSSKKSTYIKISESEIANDYPLPAYYKPSVEEMDEYIFFENEDCMSYRDLPTRVLTNWALYNSDSRLISLELLPMKACADVDVIAFGSGNMRDDDGCGFCSEGDLVGQSSGTSNSMDVEGIPIYLSAIKEWVIEFGGSMIIVSIRTDVAWYRLGKPTKQYAPWYEPVLKTARLAVSIITLLKEQSRVSRLSFTDVIKKISEFKIDHPAYISSNLPVVERYVVVHGQIILQQFADYPDPTIQKSSFVAGLSEKMEQKHHTKLLVKKKMVVQKEANLNPSASMCPISKRKLMRATTTKLVNRIWADYYSKFFPDDSKDEEQELKEEIEDEQEENEQEEVEEENILLQENDSSKSPSSARSSKPKICRKETKWEGKATGRTDLGENLYRSAIVHGEVISVGMAVMIEADESEEVPAIYFVEFMFEKLDGAKVVHGRLMLRASETVLGNAAKERELFLTNDCMEFELEDVKESVALKICKLPWGHKYRKEHADADNIDRAKAEERKKNGLPTEYYCKSLYWPEKGAFFSAPFDHLGLGTGVCYSCKEKEVQEDEVKLSSKTSLMYKKTEYNIHDFVYARPQFFAEDREDDQGTFKAGRNVGLKAYVVCQILEILAPSGSKQPTPTSTKVKVRRFYRPEDISAAKSYCSDIREVYYSEDTIYVPVEILEGKCEVRKKIELPDLELPVIVDHIFFCEYSYDAVNGSVKQLPTNVKLWSHNGKVANTSSRRNKGKGKCIEGEDHNLWKDIPQESRLATLDIFAGCGGLSEGLQQAGISFTKWAIEYEQPAGEAFSQNHPDASMFIDNCNVILRAIMEKCGDVDDCISTAEADELAAGLKKEKVNNLPVPGQVDFINGGPPCQGFSGMNRFNHSTWSKVQCEMILAFLSFAEYFRPRYFLLENVRNFVSFNKGQTFRLTLASLLEMGYQVRFGILEAGAYGVSQSRKRAFIWAASPEETLPEWPEPMHVFAGSELKISLGKGVHYAAVRSTAGGAAFRPITVRDTIGDLPPVENGASKPTIDYGGDPVSWFQKQIRGNMLALNDHISKEMNELNLIRCQRIPKRPGSDWRDLPDEKVKLSSGQTVDLIPWCLPNTAKRHNQWKGLFGRLDWEGNFPTSITDPQPMGKVGMCFHPEQDRILTVRECARSQGFRDSYLFSGNIQNRHRQIGNAVPPPLAYALGRKLKEAVDAKRASS